MATIFLESGTTATQDFSFWSSTTGTVTSDGTSPIRNPRSIKSLNTGPGQLTRTGILADAGRRISFRFKFDTLPPSSSTVILAIRTAASTSVASLGITTAGKLNFTAAGISTVVGTRTLSVNVPYRIAFSYFVTSATVFTFNVYLNGILETTAVNTGTLTNTTGVNFRLTGDTNFGSGTFVWFDDIYVDSGTDAKDPGNIIVTNKRPNANGTLNEFTTQIGSGGSGYGTGHSPQVNEQPLSLTNGWSIASASLKTEEYTIENAATGDLNASNRYRLVDYMGWVHAKVGSAGTRNIIVNGSASNISLTTAATTFFAAAASTTYPSGATAIGMNNNSVNNLTSFYECGILLAYKLSRRVSIS